MSKRTAIKILICQNCGREYPEDAELPALKDLLERVSPGDTMPHGECLDCGAAVVEEFKVLDCPLTVEEIKVQVSEDPNGYCAGVIRMDLDDLIGTDLEEFLNTISVRLIGSDLLMDAEYEIVGHSDTEFLLLVSGDPSSHLN